MQAFPDGFFDRDDPRPDADFYEVPRLVHHLDERALAGVTALYAERAVESGDVLDLMRS